MKRAKTPSRTGAGGSGWPFGGGGAGAVANRLKGPNRPPFRPPRSLENMEGCKGRYAPGEEGEDLEARDSPLHRPDGGPGGGGPALEGLDAQLS